MKYEFLELYLEEGYQVLRLTEDKVEKEWVIQLPLSSDCLFWTEEEKRASLDDGKRLTELTEEQIDFLKDVENDFFSKYESYKAALAAINQEEEDEEDEEY